MKVEGEPDDVVGLRGGVRTLVGMSGKSTSSVSLVNLHLV